MKSEKITVTIEYDPKYSSEMHNIFDTGAIVEILKSYRHQGMEWILDTKRKDGINVLSSMIDTIEEGEEYLD